MTRRHRYYWIFGSIAFVLIGALVAIHLYLHIWVRDYLNRQLASIPGYKGQMQEISIQLYRGAYTIHELEIRKIQGGMPVPFVRIPTMDLSVEWAALWHGRVVAEIDTERPVLNFAVNREGSQVQAGQGVDWTQQVKKLMPIDINRVGIKDGRITFKDFSTQPKVDLDIHHIQGEVRNLRSVVEKDKPLPSSIHFTGDSIGGGKLQIDGRMNALATPLEIETALKLEKVDLTALNSFFRGYTAVDVKKGKFDLYSEIAVHRGQVRGYVKPILTDVSLIELAKERNPVQLVWETIVSVVMQVFTNQRKDQFATKIPLSGHIDNINTDSWSTIAGIIHNAFISAIKKGTDGELKPASAKAVKK